MLDIEPKTSVRRYPSQSGDARMTEIDEKFARLRLCMKAAGHSAVRFRGVDWFAWATAGGSNVVIMTDEAGVAEVLVTIDKAWILTNRIEARRLREEEIPAGFEVCEFPWADTRPMEEFVRTQSAGGQVASDRPVAGEVRIGSEIRDLKLILCAGEIARYRELGRDAAIAMREALEAAQSDWTEFELAGAGAQAMWKRGIHPTLTLVAGERRLPIHRHATAGPDKLGGRAMLVFCGRRHGLYANLTRFVYLRKPTQAERDLHQKVAGIEAAVLDHTRSGYTIDYSFDRLAEAYIDAGFGNEILNHHQGGPCGYLSREAVARTAAFGGQMMPIHENMAFAWNPSLPGVKIEDTVLLGAGGKIEVLTTEPGWPTIEVAGRARPDILIRA